jgi:hypothetical protein
VLGYGLGALAGEKVFGIASQGGFLEAAFLME